MYARVTFAQVRPGELEATMGLLRDTLYPAFKRMEGFEGAFLLINPAVERVCGITLWESEDLMPRVTQTTAGAGGRATRRFFEAPPGERLATIPLAGQPGREVYRVGARLSVSQPGDTARARVLTARALPGQMDRVAAIVRCSAQTAIQEQPGFLYYLVLIQAGAGIILAVTLWESEAHAESWEAGLQCRRLVGQMTPLLEGPPTVDRYEVSLRV